MLAAYCQHVGLGAVLALRPQLKAIDDRDQACRDAQGARHPAHGADDDVVDLQSGTDLARIRIGLATHEAGGAHAQARGRGERVDEILDDAVREVLVIRRAHEREHRDRRGRGRCWLL